MVLPDLRKLPPRNTSSLRRLSYGIGTDVLLCGWRGICAHTTRNATGEHEPDGARLQKDGHACQVQIRGPEKCTDSGTLSAQNPVRFAKFRPLPAFSKLPKPHEDPQNSSEILQLLGLVAKKIEFPADVRTHGICLQTNPKGAPAFPVICRSVFLHIRLNGWRKDGVPLASPSAEKEKVFRLPISGSLS